MKLFVLETIFYSPWGGGIKDTYLIEAKDKTSAEEAGRKLLVKGAEIHRVEEFSLKKGQPTFVTVSHLSARCGQFS